MVQATTPTFILTLPSDIDLSLADSIVLTITQGNYTLTKRKADITVAANVVSVYLSQEETLHFHQGAARLQLNWTYGDHSRACSNIVDVIVEDNLLKEVLV